MNKQSFWLICIFAYLTSCQNQTPNRPVSAEPQTITAHFSPNLTYDIIPGKDNTFGYEISVNGKKLIHQEEIPGVAGVLGFKTADQAKKTAEFLIQKMKKGESLPAISITELKQLGVL